MTQVLTDRATLEQLVEALNNAEDALNNSQALIAGRERFGFAKTCYAANEIALGFVSPAITAGRAALANAESIGWQAIETAPATANNVLAFSESGSMKIETGFWLLNMLHAANVDGEKCNYTHWMPLPSRPGATL